MSWDEADERVRAYANGLLARGVRQGRQRRAPRPEQPRLGARRLRARADRRGRHPRLRVELRRATSATSSRTRRPSAIVCEDADAAREGRGGLGGAPRRCSTCSRTTTSKGWPRTAATSRRRTRRSRRRHGGDRRGRPLHDHLHVGHDRAAEGLHALEPQLLRDGERRRPDGGDVLPRPTTSCSSTSRSRTTTDG